MKALTVVIVLSLAGCGGPLADGKSEFGRGRYSEAKQTFLSTEAAARAWSASDQAEYALYRGLTHAALGDRASAAAWLALAKSIASATPGSLSPADTRRLTIGLDELEMLQ
jgi:hypothetical protein